LCHGYTSFKNGFHLPALAQSLAEAGYNSLRWVFDTLQLQYHQGIVCSSNAGRMHARRSCGSSWQGLALCMLAGAIFEGCSMHVLACTSAQQQHLESPSLGKLSNQCTHLGYSLLVVNSKLSWLQFLFSTSLQHRVGVRPLTPCPSADLE
jgi:hypothetical protein